jgi:hypothetical protein
MHERQPLQPKKCALVLPFPLALEIYSKRPSMRISAQSPHHTSYHKATSDHMSYYIGDSQDQRPSYLLEVTSRTCKFYAIVVGSCNESHRLGLHRGPINSPHHPPML